MGMRPRDIEGWGALAILKEAARLLYFHFRLFMPFFLAFQLPASLLATFLTVFRPVASLHALTLITSFFKTGAAYATAQELEDVNTDNQGPGPSLILINASTLVVYILNSLVLAAYANIVEYIYTESGDVDDSGITKKVFKSLPHAFLRVVVTTLWWSLVLFLFGIACVIYGLIFNGIFTAIAGGPSGPTPALLQFMLVAFVIGNAVLYILFVLAPCIAVLEPENYGRTALLVSIKYGRGRRSTIFCLILVSVALGVLVSGPSLAVGKAALPVWVEIAVAILLSVLSSLVGAYFAVVGVVMYLVCKSNFEAMLPEFQRGSYISAAGINPYEPLIYGATTV